MTGTAVKGKQIHNEIDWQGLLQKDTMLGTTIVDMHFKCGAILKAQQVPNRLPLQNVLLAMANAVGTGSWPIFFKMSLSKAI